MVDLVFSWKPLLERWDGLGIAYNAPGDGLLHVHSRAAALVTCVWSRATSQHASEPRWKSLLERLEWTGDWPEVILAVPRASVSWLRLGALLPDQCVCLSQVLQSRQAGDRLEHRLILCSLGSCSWGGEVDRGLATILWWCLGRRCP